MRDNINSILTFLYSLPAPMPYVMIQANYNHLNLDESLDALSSLNLLIISKGSQKGLDEYSLKASVKEAMENLPRKYNSDPYGYFLNLEARQNANINHTVKENRHSAIISLLVKYWWAVAIPLIVGVLIILFEHSFY